MTFKRLFIFLLLQLILLTILKYIFYSTWQIGDTAAPFFLYAAASCVIVAVLIQKVGIINFLEAIFVAILLFVVDFFGDALITTSLVGKNILATRQIWIAYLLAMLSVFVFHKKRHLHIRKQMHKQH